MTTEVHDPREIPVLTDAVEKHGQPFAFLDAKAVHAAIVTETLNLADSLLHQATKDIEATLYERVLDQLPELVDRVLREHAASINPPETDS
jgi:hypothetical protein